MAALLTSFHSTKCPVVMNSKFKLISRQESCLSENLSIVIITNTISENPVQTVDTK